MSISPPHGVELGGSKDWYDWKYYNVLKLQITFTLGLNADKNTDYMEKSFK